MADALPILMTAWSAAGIVEDRKRRSRRLKGEWRKGDVLYVKEPYLLWAGWNSYTPSQVLATKTADLARHYLANGEPKCDGDLWGRYRHAQYMPRALSRLTLRVTADSHREPLWDITEEEALLEGCLQGSFNDGCQRHRCSNSVRYHRWALTDFACLWDSLHPKPPNNWVSDPIVSVLSFEEVTDA